MEVDVLRTRLAAAQARQRHLLQQRARLVELLEQAVTQVHVSQGQIAELTDLLALTAQETT